jgi:acyl carrier protein
MLNNVQAIETLIVGELLEGSGRSKLDPEESLISSGILDSLSLLRLVAKLEEDFDTAVEDGELIPNNFESISRIVAFIDRKRGG